MSYNDLEELTEKTLEHYFEVRKILTQYELSIESELKSITLVDNTNIISQFAYQENEIENALEKLRECNQKSFEKCKYDYYLIRSSLLSTCLSQTTTNLHELDTFISEYKLNEMPTINSLTGVTQDQLTFIRNYLGDELSEQILDFLKSNDRLIKCLDDYEAIMTQLEHILSVLHQQIIQVDACFGSNESDELIQNLTHTVRYLNDIFAKSTLTFASYCKNHDRPEEILFKNVFKNRNAIARHYHKLALMFHPDKLDSNANEAKRDLMREFMAIVNVCRSKMESKLVSLIECENDIGEYEKKGDEFYALSLDYRRCWRNELDKLNVLNRNDLGHMTPAEFKRQSTYYADMACEQYMSACKLVDKFKVNDKQIELRKKISTCLLKHEKPLESLFYSFSSFALALRVNSKPLIERTYPHFESLLQTTHDLDETLIQTANKMFNSLKKNNANLNINLLVHLSDTFFRLLTNELFLRNVSSSRHIEATELKLELVLSKKPRIYDYLGSGGMGMFGLLTSVYVPNLIGTSVAVLAIGLSLYVAKNFIWNKSQHAESLQKENKIRQCLNETLNSAIEHYNNQNYELFLTQLANVYDYDLKHAILKYTKDYLNIDVHTIVDSLLKRCISPDVVALFLTLIANALLSGQIKCKKWTREKLQNLATVIFDSTCNNQQLSDEAKRLDGVLSKFICFVRADERNKSSNFTSSFNYHTKSDPSINNQRVNQKPFTQRLLQIQMQCKLNSAILMLISNGYDGYEAAQTYLNEIKSFYPNMSYPYLAELQHRVHKLESYIECMTGDQIENTSSIVMIDMLTNAPDNNKRPPTEINIYFRYLDSMLRRDACLSRLSSCLLKKAQYLTELYNKSCSDLQLVERSLAYLIDAFYACSCREKSTLDEVLKNIATCFRLLKRDKEAIEFIENNENILDKHDKNLILTYLDESEPC